MLKRFGQGSVTLDRDGGHSGADDPPPGAPMGVAPVADVKQGSFYEYGADGDET
ncbi:hypothetical protein GCM10009805_31210 [Leucobacter chromiireducens subsp. solipictus]